MAARLYSYGIGGVRWRNRHKFSLDIYVAGANGQEIAGNRSAVTLEIVPAFQLPAIVRYDGQRDLIPVFSRTG